MSKTPKVDLTLLKKLVAELERTLTVVDTIRAAVPTTPDIFADLDTSVSVSGDTAKSHTHDYIIELSKSSGLAACVMQEAGLLVGDIQSLILMTQNPTPAKGGDILDKLLGGGFKGGPLGGGTHNGGNTN